MPMQGQLHDICIDELAFNPLASEFFSNIKPFAVISIEEQIGFSIVEENR
jgi:hypothetical protein